jgi:hypothetical protein
MDAMRLTQLQNLFGPASTLDFAALFKALNLKKPVDKVIVTTPAYFKSMLRPRGGCVVAIARQLTLVIMVE